MRNKFDYLVESSGFAGFMATIAGFASIAWFCAFVRRVIDESR